MFAPTRRDSLLGLAALTTLSGCGAGAVALPPQGARKIALDLTGPRPTAALMLGGKGPVTAIFDSGAAASVIQLRFAAEAGLPNEGDVEASAPSGAPVRGYRTTISGRLGEADFPPSLAAALDIPLPLPGIDAVISPAVFKGRLVRFDFARSLAEVLDLTAANTPTTAPAGYSRNLNPFQVSRTPNARVVLPGSITLEAMVDTGSAGTAVLPMEMAARLPLTGPLQPLEDVRRVGASYPAKTAVLAGAMRVGEAVFDQPELTFAEGVPNATIGIKLLRRTIIVLDPGGYRAWVLPAG